MSPTQRDLFLAHQRAPRATTYSLGVSAALPRRVDVSLWRRALAAVVHSEPALRSCFAMSRDEVVAWTDEGCTEPFTALRGVEDIDRYVRVPYDLEAGPLVRHALAQQGERPPVAVVAAHHIVLDAPGGVLFLARAWETYLALEAGLPPPRRRAAAFADYAAQSIAMFDTPTCRAAWTERLRDVVPLIPLADRPASPAMHVAHALLDLRCPVAARAVAPRVLAGYAYALASMLRPRGRFIIHDLAGSRHGCFRETIGCLYQVIPVVFPPDAARRGASANWVEHAATYRPHLGQDRHISVALQRRFAPREGVRFHFNFYAFDRFELSGTPTLAAVHDGFPADEAHLLAKPRHEGVRLELHHPASVDGERLLAAVVDACATMDVLPAVT